MSNEIPKHVSECIAACVLKLPQQYRELATLVLQEDYHIFKNEPEAARGYRLHVAPEEPGTMLRTEYNEIPTCGRGFSVCTVEVISNHSRSSRIIP